MRTASFFFPLVLAGGLAGCGGKSPPAQSADNADNAGDQSADQGGDSDKPLTKEEKAARRAEREKERAENAAGKGGGDSDEKSQPCGGPAIADLAAVLAQSSCLVPNGNPDGKQEDLGEQLEVKASADRFHIEPGGNAKINVVFRNKGKADLSLDFVVDPEPRFDFELYTAKGKRADLPPGNEPSLPPEVANAPAVDKQVARITLPPQGTARVSLDWSAVKFKWASKEKAKGAVAGRGYPREPAGPLPKGKYELRVLTPLVNVFDGADHDMSQPKAQIEITK
jgi:hypothetical protein